MSETADKRFLFRILEDKSFILSLVIIAPFIILIFIIIIYLRDIEIFKDVSAVYAGWVGSVIGYFFGSRQVDKLIEKIDVLARLSEQRVNELEEEKRKYDEKNRQLQQLEAEMIRNNEKAKAEVDKAKDFIEMLKKRFLD